MKARTIKRLLLSAVVCTVILQLVGLATIVFRKGGGGGIAEVAADAEQKSDVLSLTTETRSAVSSGGKENSMGYHNEKGDNIQGVQGDDVVGVDDDDDDNIDNDDIKKNQNQNYNDNKRGVQGDDDIDDDDIGDDDNNDDDYPQDNIPPEQPIVKSTDLVMKQGWNDAPVVIEEYNLLFFTIPKISCTVFKMLFRRMMGYEDWKTSFGNELHDPNLNGLKYLSDYPLDKAQHMLTSPNWTRAIFIREPKQRLLSAYLDKVVNRDFVSPKCCRLENRKIDPKCSRTIKVFSGFIEVAKKCLNPHWMPLVTRMDEKFWPFVNFQGNFDDLAGGTKELLLKLGNGAWEDYGQTGWGKYGNESIFWSASTLHATGAGDKVPFYYTVEMERDVEKMFRKDYMRFQFAKEEGHDENVTVMSK